MIRKPVVLAGVFVAVCVALSGLYVPIGPTKVYPFQHMVNAIAGVLLGPGWAAIIATIAAIIRNLLGVGTIFAFPGGIPGGIVVGLLYRYIRKDWVALFEPLGTGPIGATISAWIVVPYIQSSIGWTALQTAFLASSIPGSILGFIVLKIIRKGGVLKDGGDKTGSR
ncbi:MAG: energy coupling factor transporter S component ThiW [Synergistetes bacterium]|nr:MAG: ThiW protein [bacterium 42_11]MBC7332592.1 energy coupling factor transporter S component ThiW [Synergistota bacterium]MDK2872141.1 hypothetical protein [bacterium]